MDERQLKRIYQLTVNEREKCTETYAQYIAYYLTRGYKLLLDMDGVVVKSNSFEKTTPTTYALIDALKKLEEKNVDIGAATARGRKIVQELRGNYAIKMQGPSILEEGQILLINDTEHCLVKNPERHQAFIQKLQVTLRNHPAYVDTWDEVKAAHKDGKWRFCPGNYQWQGTCRMSNWYPKDSADPNLEKFYLQRLTDIVVETAAEFELKVGIDVKLSQGIMDQHADDLRYLGIKAFSNGSAFTKADALKKILGVRWIFIADGPGDAKIAEYVSQRNGIVIGVRESFDINQEIGTFLKYANLVVENPEELARVLGSAAKYLYFPVQQRQLPILLQ